MGAGTNSPVPLSGLSARWTLRSPPLHVKPPTGLGYTRPDARYALLSSTLRLRGKISDCKRAFSGARGRGLAANGPQGLMGALWPRLGDFCTGSIRPLPPFLPTLGFPYPFIASSTP